MRRDAQTRQQVQYSLTDLGATLVEPIEALTTWARNHGEAIVDFRQAAEG